MKHDGSFVAFSDLIIGALCVCWRLVLCGRDRGTSKTARRPINTAVCSQSSTYWLGVDSVKCISIVLTQCMWEEQNDLITWYSQHCAPRSDCSDVVETGLRAALLLTAACCPSVVAGDSLAGRRPSPHWAVTGERRLQTVRKTQFLEGNRLSHYGRDTLLSQRGSRWEVAICWAALLHIQSPLLLPGRVDRSQDSACFLEILTVGQGREMCFQLRCV